jgi:teichuronopeptide biosynthesis TupA-like protein
LDFLRVDMYNVNGRIVFGEFTNYPGAGLDRFFPPEFDELFGSTWRVPPRYV